MQTLIKPKPMNNTKTMALFEHWNNTLQTGDAKQVTQLYESDAVLLPTISNQVRHNHNEIKDYFVLFLENSPKGEINESNIQNLGEIIIHSGIYTFRFKDDSNVKARFCFVYHWNGQDWTRLENNRTSFITNARISK